MCVKVNLSDKRMKKKLSKYQNHVIASMSKMAWLMRPPTKSSRLNLDSVKTDWAAEKWLDEGFENTHITQVCDKKIPTGYMWQKILRWGVLLFLKILTRHMWSPPAPTYRYCSRWAQSSPPLEAIVRYKNIKKTKKMQDEKKEYLGSHELRGAEEDL